MDDRTPERIAESDMTSFCWNNRGRRINLRRASTAIAAMIWLTSVVFSQTPETQQNPTPPTFRVEVWGNTITDFNNRVGTYVELRTELEKGLPPRKATDNVAEIKTAERALADKIRAARPKAKQGDIFSPAVSTQFKKALRAETNVNTWAGIMDDNPGKFPVQPNETYPDDKPLSTVPPNILALLPPLPDDVQYRFLGRHLILYDTRARLIIDRIPNAISSKNRNWLQRLFSSGDSASSKQP